MRHINDPNKVLCNSICLVIVSLAGAILSLILPFLQLDTIEMMRIYISVPLQFGLILSCSLNLLFKLLKNNKG